jgi:hypothetical protein
MHSFQTTPIAGYGPMLTSAGRLHRIDNPPPEHLSFLGRRLTDLRG